MANGGRHCWWCRGWQASFDLATLVRIFRASFSIVLGRKACLENPQSSDIAETRRLNAAVNRGSAPDHSPGYATRTRMLVVSGWMSRASSRSFSFSKRSFAAQAELAVRTTNTPSASTEQWCRASASSLDKPLRTWSTSACFWRAFAARRPTDEPGSCSS